MSSIKKCGVLIAAIASFFISTAEAQATLQIQISINGGAFTTATALSPFTTVALNTSSGGVSFALNGSSNQPTGSPFSQISQSNLTINGNTTGNVLFSSIVIRVTDTGFLSPTGAATLSSSFSGSYGAGVSAVGNQTFQSFANLSNTAFATSGLTGGAQNFTLPAVTTTTAFNGSQDTAVNISSTPFSLTNTFTFSQFTIGAGAQLQVTGTTNLQTPAVPEPMTIVATLSGLPVLGGFMWRRRKVIA
jgi:hypothetical protein